MADHLQLWEQFDPPCLSFTPECLGPLFDRELDLVSRLWFRCGYRPGIGAYLNFFLLSSFITTHDEAFPPRFSSFQSMAKSFYRTDLFIREVTDSGMKPTGGLSSARVRTMLGEIMARHQRLRIPHWMMTYFGFSLLENVETQCAPLSEADQQLHLAYMSKAYRIMGFRFSEDRGSLEQFARSIEEEHAGLSPHVERHSRNILMLAEMIGVSSGWEHISAMLPVKTRNIFQTIYHRVRPNLVQRLWARCSGRILMPKAVGSPRRAVPAS